MKKVVLIMIGILLSHAGFSQRTASIRGNVMNEKNNTPIFNAYVFVYKDSVRVGWGLTDFDGKYYIEPLTFGVYRVTISSFGFKSEVIDSFFLKKEEEPKLDVCLERKRMGLTKGCMLYLRVRNCGGALEAIADKETIEELKDTSLKDSVKPLLLTKAIETKTICYPNPATDYISLEVNGLPEMSKTLFVELFSMAGVKMGEYEMKENTLKINTSGFPAGIYTYQILVEGTKLGVGKFLVNR